MTPPLDPLTLSDLEALAALVIADAAPPPAPRERDPVEREVDALFAEPTPGPSTVGFDTSCELAAYLAERFTR